MPPSFLSNRQQPSSPTLLRQKVANHSHCLICPLEHCRTIPSSTPTNSDNHQRHHSLQSPPPSFSSPSPENRKKLHSATTFQQNSKFIWAFFTKYFRARRSTVNLGKVDDANDDSSFENDNHYDLPIQQVPQYFHGQPSGAQFKPQPEFQQFPQQHEPRPEFPLDIYSQLVALRCQGNRHEAAIRRIEEQHARANNYMEDLWHHFRPEGGYRPRGPLPR
ncbi:unnamed protein product [Lactuca virosa]|uniref:Uncharacterized protein n=1 Tax=Lactuca virosa TaxID=75947 RepID=A0AAU9P7S7_9ASTR|nr:unnamed protein product [Lactuca virosa]